MNKFFILAVVVFLIAIINKAQSEPLFNGDQSLEDLANEESFYQNLKSLLYKHSLTDGDIIQRSDLEKRGASTWNRLRKARKSRARRRHRG